MVTASSSSRSIAPHLIRANPFNPRLYFNEEKLDLLKTSVQEVGVLVPLIVYPDPAQEGRYVLLDGERRWRSALDLGLTEVPVNIVLEPSRLDNLLRMFNIHSVREDWPLISVALSLRTIMDISHEERESRLAEMTGLTRSTVRRSKRLLSLPETELDLIQHDAHLDRPKQIHKEDLYLEIEAAESVLRNELPELAEEFARPQIIRQFARKREEGRLRAVTDFRNIGKVIESIKTGLVEREQAVSALRRLVTEVDLNPSEVFDEVAADAYRQQALTRRSELLFEALAEIRGTGRLSEALRRALLALREEIDQILRGSG